MRAVTLASLGALLGFGLGCGEPTLVEATDDIAQVRCERFDECGDVGAGERYPSFDRCVSEQTAEFEQRWPVERCAEGHLNEELYDSCLKRAETIACSGALQASDQQAFDAACSARQLCVDPSEEGGGLPPEPSREEYREELAHAQCNRAQECGQIGVDARYPDFEACLVSVRADVDDFWPADRCDDRVDETIFDQCKQKLIETSCDGLGGLVQALDFLASCNASRVCTK